MARTLAKKSSHSYLHVSSGGGSGSHDSTPDWTLDDEHDELTDKVTPPTTNEFVPPVYTLCALFLFSTTLLDIQNFSLLEFSTITVKIKCD